MDARTLAARDSSGELAQVLQLVRSSRPRSLLHFHGALNKHRTTYFCGYLRPADSDAFHMRRTCSPTNRPWATSASPIMHRGISKVRTGRARVKLSKALQEALLAADASSGAGMKVESVGCGLCDAVLNSSGTERPQSPKEQSPDALLPSTKRTLDDIDPLTTKRARLATDAQQPMQTTLQQPKPKPSLP